MGCDGFEGFCATTGFVMILQCAVLQSSVPLN